MDADPTALAHAPPLCWVGGSAPRVHSLRASRRNRVSGGPAQRKAVRLSGNRKTVRLAILAGHVVRALFFPPLLPHRRSRSRILPAVSLRLRRALPPPRQPARNGDDNQPYHRGPPPHCAATPHRHGSTPAAAPIPIGLYCSALLSSPAPPGRPTPIASVSNRTGAHEGSLQSGRSKPLLASVTSTWVGPRRLLSKATLPLLRRLSDRQSRTGSGSELREDRVHNHMRRGEQAADAPCPAPASQRAALLEPGPNRAGI